jgi:ankyrin repeat protein
LDNLRRGFPASIRNALEQLPESLDEVYKHALLRIDKARRKFARRLFECLAVAARPLRVEELADILEVPFDKGQVSESNTLSGAEEAVLFACSSLITIVDAAGGSRVVQFFHFSVEEFLTSDRLAEEGPDLSYYHVTPQRANTTFAKTCLRVLLTLDKQINREGIKDFPLAHYASRHWFDHCLRLEDMPKDLHRDTLLLFNRNEPHFSAWVWLYDMDDPSEKTMSTGYPEQPKAVPLYYAVRGGFRWLVEGLASAHPEDVNDRGGYFETPLFAAFAMEDDKSAASLLRCRADPNVLNNDGASILHYASQSGDVGFVWLLLKHNADVNLPNAEGQTPLGLSSVGGHLEVCRLLVQRDAKVDARDHNGRTPLGLSSVGGHLEVCRLLVQRDAKVDARDHNGRTPLWIASHLGYLDVVLYLIDNCADVNSADNDGWSPLQSARSQCHPDVVQLLLDRGAVLELCKPHENIPPNSSANPESGNREYELTNFTPERITGSLDGAANPSNSEEETSSSDVAQQPQTLREETKTTIDERPADTVFGDGQLDMVLFISCLFIFIAFLWAESSSLN